MIADIVAFWLAGSRDRPDRASAHRGWWYRGGPAADVENGMNKNSTLDSTVGLESSEPPERALARAIVADAVDRYLEATRARIVPFVDDHFSFSNAWALHQRALGRDLLRAPVNVMLVLPQVVLLPAAAALARRAGWRRGADWLGCRQLLRETDVAREIAWLVYTELLRLPYRQGPRESARDALAEEVFGDPRTEAADRCVLEELARRTSDTAFRRDLEDKLAAYKLSRSAVAELCTAIVSVAIGAAVFGQLTFGVMSLGPALAHEAAQRHAIESFPLGSWLGGLWYGVFPATPSLLATIGAMAGLVLAFSVLSAFAGVVADPVQRRLGRHRRLLERLVATLGHSLRGGDPGRFAVREHWIARLLDVVDLLRTAWSKLH